MKLLTARTSTLITIVSLMACGCAFADQFQFDSPGSNVWNGVYVNPYYAHKTPGVVNTLQIYCDDWNTDFSGNPSWDANVYSLNQGNVQYFKFGKITTAYDISETGHVLTYTPVPVSSLDIYHRYLEVAWLDDKIEHSASDNTKRELSAAMWTLFVDPAHVTSLIDNGINQSGDTFVDDVFLDLTNAHTAALGNKYVNWDVIVPTTGVIMQEFLVPGAPVPEPGAVVLLGSMVGILAFTKFRRKRTREDS